MIFIKKNRELYENLIILAGQLTIIAEKFQQLEKMRLGEIYIYVVENFLLKWIFRQLYLKKLKKMLKIADFANFGPKYLGPQIFPRHAVWSSKLEI